jgi:predicted RNase H-like HicB family nuclease
VTRAADVPGAWVAECIPLGVVTQGDSLKHAIDMLAEAVDMVIDDDLQRGVDPLQTRAPLDESSGEFAKLMSHPLTPVDVEAVDASVSIVVVMLKVVRPHVPAMAVSERPSLAKRYESLMAPLQATAC